MIIYHQENISAFAGNHIYYWIGQPLFAQQISVTSAAPTFKIIWAAESTIVIQPGAYT